MKFMRICLLVCGLMLAFVGVTYASSFSVSADKYGKVEGNGIEFSFSENNKIIQIAFLTKDNERYLIAGKDGEPIYAAKILNVKYVRTVKFKAINNEHIAILRLREYLPPKNAKKKPIR